MNVRPEQLKGKRKICLYLTDEAYGKLQTARGFGQTTSQAISKAIKQLLERPEEIKPIKRRRVYVRMAAVRYLLLSSFSRRAGLTLSQLVDLALRRYTPMDPFKEAEALKRKLQAVQDRSPKSDLGIRGEGGSRRPTTASQ